jgi:ribose 5-phosphate isomerase RpiB
VSEVRISLFSKGNYIQRKNQIVKALLAGDLTITDRRYIGHEDDTSYHHYAIDVAKNYELED